MGEIYWSIRYTNGIGYTNVKEWVDKIVGVETTNSLGQNITWLSEQGDSSSNPDVYAEYQKDDGGRVEVTGGWITKGVCTAIAALGGGLAFGEDVALDEAPASEYTHPDLD